MIGADEIASRREDIAASPHLAALRDRLVERAAPVIDRMPHVPDVKAMLSRDGGTCPDDGAALQFDPWSPDEHRCPQCDRLHRGARHHAHWARAQHLWIAERAAHLATVHAITGDAAAGARARELLTAYFQRYHDLPNRDNVLGPGHLFFSTYLESIWILDYLAAAVLLRESDLLDADDLEAVNAIADEAATLIGEFDEGMSNRQTWNAAALTAIAVWFGDDDLAGTSITGRTGLLGHLADGFGDDGMWHEGENYHLFAIRGLLIGLHWASAAGADLLHDPELAAHLGAALMAPVVTALPDRTFPARKDSRYGVSLAHPAYIESWEAGATFLGSNAPTHLDGWLQSLYETTPRKELLYDAYLHEAVEPPRERRSRADLSWWALWMLRPQAIADSAVAEPAVHVAGLLEQQGLAIVRDGTRYVALECLGGGDGHGHPDRLHLTLHADGIHWLPDPGTGSYVSRDLFWYRSTLAHNAPRLGHVDQPPGAGAVCTAFESSGTWCHVRASWIGVERAVITGPRWVVAILTSKQADAVALELPWHLAGDIDCASASGSPVSVASDFVTDAREIAGGEPMRVIARVRDSSLALHLTGGTVIMAAAPGLPGTGDSAPFLIQRTEGEHARFVAVIDPGAMVERVEVVGDVVTVHDAHGATAVAVTATETTITEPSGRTILGGMRPRSRLMPTLAKSPPPRAMAAAIRVDAPPALDGTLDGFDVSETLAMDDELCYFRSELPYPGPEQFSALAWVNWDVDTLYVAVEVTTPEVVMRESDAVPLLLDNEPEDIHAAGVQFYCRRAGEAVTAVLVRPAGTGVHARGIGAPVPEGFRAAWQPTAGGYCITAALPCPGIGRTVDRVETLDFDIVVNEMYADRQRRAGQLAWSGGPGWVYLRGDRHDPARFGALELHE